MIEVKSKITEKYLFELKRKARELGYDYDNASYEDKTAIVKIVEAAWRERGIEAEKKDKADREAQKLAEQKHAWNKYLESVPKVFKGADIKQFNASSPLVRHILSGGSALIIGGTGVGKTHLAYACAKELAYTRADAGSVLVMDMSTMLSNIKLSNKDWLREIAREYGKVQTLFIDEYDKMFGTQADYQLVSHLINIRWEEGLQTIVMGNGTEEIARNMLGAAAISRLVGKATGGAFFDVGGADRRRA